MVWSVVKMLACANRANALGTTPPSLVAFTLLSDVPSPVNNVAVTLPFTLTLPPDCDSDEFPIVVPFVQTAMVFVVPVP
jgi:hypothetical protein